MASDTLPSWRSGPVKDALSDFLRAARHLPREQRTAVIGHDGVLVCEKPSSLVSSFYGSELRAAVAARPDLAERGDYRVLLECDNLAGPEGFGLRRTANAVFEICGRMTPEEYTERVRRFCAGYVHPDLGLQTRDLVYRPMLELVETLRDHDFTVFVIAHIGLEFTRSISHDLYGVPPENVIGALVDYDFEPVPGGFRLVRAADIRSVGGEHSEVLEVVSQTGRRPSLCAVRTPGERDVLDYTLALSEQALALSIVHDDDTREYAYPGDDALWPDPAAERTGPGREVLVSMRDTWSTIFGEGP